MNELIKVGELGTQEVMTSLQIAEVTGKEHSNIMRDIRTIVDQIKGLGGFNFELSSYISQQNKELPMYILTKKDSLLLASGYDPLLRAKIINRWEELEKSNMHKLPQTYIAALEALIESEKKKEALLLENKKQSEEIVEMAAEMSGMSAKVSYVDTILSSKKTVLVTQIAQDYGLSAKILNRKLESFGVQRKVGGQWVLYAKHLAKGYVQSKTVNITRSSGKPDIVLNTEWTQAGRLFLYQLLKSNGILPLIEK